MRDVLVLGALILVGVLVMTDKPKQRSKNKECEIIKDKFGQRWMRLNNGGGFALLSPVEIYTSPSLVRH